jgi:hypothetical protein
MPYTIGVASEMASGAAALLLGLLLILRHVLLPRLSERQLRRFDAPLVLLFGVFLVYLIANFLEALP